MTKLGIVGTDSTHFDCFLQFISQHRHDLSRWYPSNANSRHTLVDQDILVDKKALSLEEVINTSDCVLILNRFANDHFIPAIGALLAGKKVFIDKPIFDSLDCFASLDSIFKLHPDWQPNIFSCSPLRYCQEVTALKGTANHFLITAPRSCVDIGDDSRFNSPLFYGIHGTDIASALVGGIKSFSFTSPGSIVFSGNSATAEVTLVKDIEEEYTIASNSSDPISICLDGSYYKSQMQDILSWASSDKVTVPCQISDTKIQISSLLSLEV